MHLYGAFFVIKKLKSKNKSNLSQNNKKIVINKKTKKIS
jgi:hypothetical protein